MECNPIADFATIEVLPLLLDEAIRERSLAECFNYIRLRQECPERPVPFPFDLNAEFDVREIDKPPLLLCERYAILAAVAELYCKQEEKIDPVPFPKHMNIQRVNFRENKIYADSRVWAVLRGNIHYFDEGIHWNVGQLFIPMLQQCLRAVQQDLQCRPPCSSLITVSQMEEPPSASNLPKPKRSTVKREAQANIISALSKYHKYNTPGTLCQFPIGVNELARLADVSNSSVSLFFGKHTKGYDHYRIMCEVFHTLLSFLKAINGDYSPHELV